MAANKLIQDLLECGICLHQYNQPRGLPCLHCFCHECLTRYCQGKTHILCPNCRNPTAVPKEGVSGFPAHFMANTLQETLDMEKLKICEAAAHSICTNCNLPDKKPIVHCLDCKEFFCQTCHAAHNTLKIFSQYHRVVNIEDLRSGKVLLPLATSQDQKCNDHEGETKKFYCETCKKPVCRDCIVMKQHCRDHDYITLKEASKKQAARLVQLTGQGEELKKEFQDAIQETETVERLLTTSLKEADKRVEEIRNRHKQMLDMMYDKYKAELKAKKDDNIVNIEKVKVELQSSVAKVENACALATKVTQMGSDYDIASLYPTLSASLEELNEMTKPKAANEMLGYVGVEEVTKLEVPDVVSVLKGERWKQTGQFDTKPELYHPWGITVNSEGEVALTSLYYSPKVFSQTGDVKYTFQGPFDVTLHDITITPDNRYILPGETELLFYDSRGKMLKYPQASTYDTYDALPWALAVDSKGRVIAGLHGNTISIHHTNGQLISKFATPRTPRWLAVTSKGDIAAQICDTLQLMDYSGNNVREVQPPQGVTNWSPDSVCCSKQGEIFVVNGGNPAGVYRYTADGDQCLGCVITGLYYPAGIAISEDGQQIFVAEFESVVKIFQRQAL
ncbi:E3 ubiquitin-protein ligase TRIM56-like [Amphiura filiformis]|uniref:E3 ubiquitin-protein ligase TRIM56-like n=1 Tax=Amphiura filiformis TaxID=82378 RepID=UPI003B2193DE